MSTIDQIVFRAPNGSNGTIVPAFSSIEDNVKVEHWRRRLDPWLRSGSPLGRGYLDFGSQAVLIRWLTHATSRYDWQYALVLIGPPAVLTAGYALELPELSADLSAISHGSRLPPVSRTKLGPGHAAIMARAQSAKAIELLVPLLARVLAGEQSVTMPWTEPSLPEAVMWSLVSILSMVGDTRPVSFLTHASGRAASASGLFVSFRPGAASLPPDPGFETVAIGLATRFADGPAELRRTLLQHGMLEPADHAGRIAQLIDLWPRLQTVNAHSEGTQTVDANFEGPSPAGTVSSPKSETADGAGQVVTCPICLHDIDDWDTLQYWRWDAILEDYAELPVPPGLNRNQRDRLVRGAYVRCPAPQADLLSEHYLPVNYGRFGPPVLLGFIGLTKSGKSHLLASMVGAIQRGELQEYGIASRPIDLALHQGFLEGWVNPLFNHDRVLPGTQEGIVTFADAFLMSQENGPERPVALFDVAGGDLARMDDTKYFLEIANGLFFVIDPEHMHARRLGDETFNNVLNVVEDKKRSGQMSAAIVLNKADKVRFEEPVTRWLRSDSGVPDPVEFLLESADVYAYLHQQGASALAGPYRVCDKATLHVASPTGGAGDGEGSVYPRGVTPRRVLRPLVAMLAMTGVLTGPEAEMVGI
jgi:hypothetical protein